MRSWVTSFPLHDAHGDLTTLLDGEGEVASRQAYDPWGAQLSGPALEMGYLGTKQRRSDPATDLVQMGIRPYSPALGSFLAEDPILGYLGFGAALNRNAYVWNNPLLYFDLTGRSIFGEATDALGDAWNATGGKVWDESAGARTVIGIAGDGNGGVASEAPGFISERAQDFEKVSIRVIPGAGALNSVLECLGEVIANPNEDSDCLPEAPESSPELEDPPEPPDYPSPPPLPPTKLPLPHRP